MRGETVAKIQLQTLFDHCTDFVFYLDVVDDNYIYRYVNPQAVTQVFEGSVPIGKKLQDAVRGSTFKTISRAYDEALKSQQQKVYRDYRLISNEAVTLETTVIPIVESNAVLAIAREISSLKVMEEENHFLTVLFEEQTNPMVILDTDFTILKTNHILYELFVDEVTLVGKNGLDIPVFEGQHKANVIAALQATLNNEKVKLQVPLEQLDGEVFQYNLMLSPILLSGEVVAICLQFERMTATLNLQKTLEETNLALESYKLALNEAVNFCITDANGFIEYVSPGYEKLTRYKAEELKGKTNAIINSRQHSRAFYAEMWNVIKSGETWRGEICNRTRTGSHFWVDTTITPMYNADGEIQNFLSICLDVTEKRVMMTNLRNIERTFKLITENTNDFIVITNEDGIILYVSPNHESRLGYEEEGLLGQFYFGVLTEDSDLLLRAEIDSLLASESDSQVELQLLTKKREHVWIEAHITSVKDTTRDEINQFVIIAREITKRKQKEDELRFMAYHDSLTLLPNRRFLKVEFAKLVTQAITFDYAITLLYIDGDNFKRINDLYGHDIGDEFIREFGQSLVKSVREYDIVSRVGGDEFIIALTHMSLNNKQRDQQVLQTIERIQTTLRKGWVIDGNHFSPTSSIGVASYPENGETIDDLMTHADAALYIAKKINGKDSYHITQ